MPTLEFVNYALFDNRQLALLLLYSACFMLSYITTFRFLRIKVPLLILTLCSGTLVFLFERWEEIRLLIMCWFKSKHKKMGQRRNTSKIYDLRWFQILVIKPMNHFVPCLLFYFFSFDFSCYAYFPPVCSANSLGNGKISCIHRKKSTET